MSTNMTKDKFKYYTKTKFIVYDRVTDQNLVLYENKYDGWDYDLCDIDSDAIFESTAEADRVIADLTASFLKNDATAEIDFVVNEYCVGNKLYEDIRKALGESYGRELREYVTDHVMTAAVMNVLEGEKMAQAESGTFSEAVRLLPDEGREILDQLFLFNITPPFISVPTKGNDQTTTIGWSKEDYYFEFKWSDEDGFEWFYRYDKTDEYGGSDGKTTRSTKLPDEAIAIIKRIFL